MELFNNKKNIIIHSNLNIKLKFNLKKYYSTQSILVYKIN